MNAALPTPGSGVVAPIVSARLLNSFLVHRLDLRLDVDVGIAGDGVVAVDAVAAGDIAVVGLADAIGERGQQERLAHRQAHVLGSGRGAADRRGGSPGTGG